MSSCSPLDRVIYESACKEAVLAAAAVLVADMSTGEILYASSPAAALFGYQGGDLVGLCVDRLLPQELQARHAEYRQLYAQAPRARPMGSGLVLRGRHQDGSEFPVQVGLVPASVLGRQVVVALVLDLTEPVKTASMIQVAGTDPESGILRRGGTGT